MCCLPSSWCRLVLMLVACLIDVHCEKSADVPQRTAFPRLFSPFRLTSVEELNMCNVEVGAADDAK